MMIKNDQRSAAMCESYNHSEVTATNSMEVTRTNRRVNGNKIATVTKQDRPSSAVDASNDMFDVDFSSCDGVKELDVERRQKRVVKKKKKEKKQSSSSQSTSSAPIKEIKIEKRSTEKRSTKSVGDTTSSKVKTTSSTSMSKKKSTSVSKEPMDGTNISITMEQTSEKTPIKSVSSIQTKSASTKGTDGTNISTGTTLEKKLEKLRTKTLANLKIGIRSKNDRSTTGESHDIVWNGFKSKVRDDSSVAGSLQGSWVSKKSVQTADGKRRNSTSASSDCRSLGYHDHRPASAPSESKRRHSTSALSSLALGDIQLSPFVKNELRSKHTRNLTLSDVDKKSYHERKLDGKRVRFAKVETALYFPSRMTITADNIRILWWTGEERVAMKRRAQRVGLRFLSITAKYHLAVEQILSKCKNEAGATSRNLYFSEKEAIRILINNEARGLELAMISALNLESCRHYHRCVKQSVTSVLNAQAMWKCSNLKSTNEQWQMIATELQQHSAVATRFARILAEGDARFVRGHYGNSSGDAESSLAPGLTEESSLSTSSSEEYDYLDGSFTI